MYGRRHFPFRILWYLLGAASWCEVQCVHMLYPRFAAWNLPSLLRPYWAFTGGVDPTAVGNGGKTSSSEGDE